MKAKGRQAYDEWISRIFANGYRYTYIADQSLRLHRDRGAETIVKESFSIHQVKNTEEQRS